MAVEPATQSLPRPLATCAMRLHADGLRGRGLRLLPARPRVRPAVRRRRDHRHPLAIDRGRPLNDGHGRAVESHPQSPHRRTVEGMAVLRPGIGLSLCANVASAPELNAFAIAVAACPPLALLLSVELLNQALKRHRFQPATNHVGAEGGDPKPAVSPSAVPNEMHPPSDPAGTADDVPALRTARRNMPGHSADSEDAAAVDLPREEAYRLDAEHWNLHRRPISAETLRRHLGIGSRRARALTRLTRQHRQPRALVLAGVE